MSEKKKTRNDQEWLELIQECHASGLSDREWCQKHSISINVEQQIVIHTNSKLF